MFRFPISRVVRVVTTLSLVSVALALAPVASAQSIFIDATIRDFKADFRQFEGTIGGLETGIAAATLDGDEKPVFSGGSFISVPDGAASFNNWFRDVAGLNISLVKSLEFEDVGGGYYQFEDTSFFPIDGEGFGNEGRANNFHFTTELDLDFTYEAGQTFEFTGDDDVFVFINNALALDLGGVHGAISDTIDLDTLGLTVGQNYSMKVFHAERHTSESNFKVRTNIALRQDRIPEPGTLAFAAMGLLPLVGVLRRRAR
jgi:fibro-slime domain-containing protein